MEKDDQIGGRLIREFEMICVDCAWRGEPEGLPATKCLQYPEGKPMDVVCRLPGATCPAFLNVKDI